MPNEQNEKQENTSSINLQQRNHSKPHSIISFLREVHDRSAHAKLSQTGANLSYEKVHKLQFGCILSK